MAASFTAVVIQTQARSLNYQVEIPLQINGVVLPERTYTVEAWLNTQPEKKFAAAANFLRVLPQPRSTWKEDGKPREGAWDRPINPRHETARVSVNISVDRIAIS